MKDIAKNMNNPKELWRNLKFLPVREGDLKY